MTKTGRQIIEGLKEAMGGDFASVTIAGQRWVRAEAIREAYEDAARIVEERNNKNIPDCIITEIAAAIRARSMEQVEQPPQQVAPDKPDSGKHG
jgi:hypothetical protein